MGSKLGSEHEFLDESYAYTDDTNGPSSVRSTSSDSEYQEPQGTQSEKFTLIGVDAFDDERINISL